MFIIWGTRGFEKDLGYTNVTCCYPHCNNVVNLIAKKIGRRFTLFWIPLFPIKLSYYILCPICRTGKLVSKNEIRQCLGVKPIDEVVS